MPTGLFRPTTTGSVSYSTLPSDSVRSILFSGEQQTSHWWTEGTDLEAAMTERSSYTEEDRQMGLATVFVTLILAGAAGQQAGTSPGTNGAAAEQPRVNRPAVNPDALPVSIERIQKALQRKPLIVLKTPEFNSDSGLPTFRIGIEGKKLTIEEILGPNYLRGPVPAGAMTHQEFLNMVTPKDVQGYAAFSNGQAATVALTSLAIQWALKNALEAFHDAKDARAKEAARKEVQDALEALRKARREAGLPDR